MDFDCKVLMILFFLYIFFSEGGSIAQLESKIDTGIFFTQPDFKEILLKRFGMFFRPI